MMVGIIKKDLLMMKMEFIIFTLISVLYTFAYIFIKFIIFESLVEDTNFSRCVLATLPLIMVLEFNCKNFQYDHTRNQYERYLNSLPVTRTQIVISKFMSSLIFTSLGLFYSLLCFVLFTVSDNASLEMSGMRNITITFIITIICICMQLPILIYNGNILMSLLGPFISLAVFISVILVRFNMNINKSITAISNFFANHTFINDNLLLLSILICLLFTSLCMTFSVYIYKRRDLQ